MTKDELISKVAETTGFKKKEVTSTLNALTNAITEELTNGGSVAFIGFGTFSVYERAARTARIPSTGAIIELPATKVAKFKAGKILKEAVCNS